MQFRHHGDRRPVRTAMGREQPTAVTALAPQPREVTGWIIRPAAERSDRERADLTRIPLNEAMA
jgi:hypothetical protein